MSRRHNPRSRWGCNCSSCSRGGITIGEARTILLAAAKGYAADGNKDKATEIRRVVRLGRTQPGRVPGGDRDEKGRFIKYD